MKAQFLEPLRVHFRRRFRNWIERRIPPGQQITLGHRNIFILPTRQAAGFLLVLLLMLVGAINYEASLAFGLVFLLLGLFLLSILHTFRNLSGLHVSGRAGPPVFAGQLATVEIVLQKGLARQHDNIVAYFSPDRQAVADLVDSEEARVQLQIPATRRGLLRPGRLVLETRFPLGLCRAWSLIDLSTDCLVYPQPLACEPERLVGGHADEGPRQDRAGQDDFHGLKTYQPGDPLRHVAWKQAARGLGMYTKQYANPDDTLIWLDWAQLPGMPMEARLSCLTWCVIQLDREQRVYGLRLPGIEIPPGRGQSQRRQVLETLALYGLPGGQA